jgi:hypothetical protein
MATTCRLQWGNQYHIDRKAVYWNEVCAWTIEKFGLPGERFETHVNEDYMDFNFYDDKDATMFSLMWNAPTIPYEQKVTEFVGSLINGL